MQDPNHALDVLQSHWETWITEDDFAAIKAAGLNHVRCVRLGIYVFPSLFPATLPLAAGVVISSLC